jgi:dUTP pyrophosphatase
MMTVAVRRLHPEARLPHHGSSGAAGYDLYSLEDYPLFSKERHLFLTGLSFGMPDGYVGLIKPRSGLAYRQGIHVLGGVIDSDYQGEVGVILLNTSDRSALIMKGDRIAQIIFQRHEYVDFMEMDALDTTTVRGQGGFGSTGDN